MSLSYQPYSNPSFGRVQGGVNSKNSPQKPDGQTDEMHGLLDQLSQLIQSNLAGTMSKLKSGTLGFEDIGAFKESMAQVEQFEAMSAQVALLDQQAAGQAPGNGTPQAPVGNPQAPQAKAPVIPQAARPTVDNAPPAAPKPVTATSAKPQTATAPHGVPPRVEAAPHPVTATTARGNPPPVGTRGAPIPVQGTAKPVTPLPKPNATIAATQGNRPPVGTRGAPIPVQGTAKPVIPLPTPNATIAATQGNRPPVGTRGAPIPVQGTAKPVTPLPTSKATIAAATQSPAKTPAKTAAAHVAAPAKPQAAPAQGTSKPTAVNAAAKPAAPSNTAGALSTQPQTKALSAAESKKVAAQYIQNLQKDFGLSKDEAAGIVANLWHESGGMNSGITQGGRIGAPNGNMADDNGNGYGIAQWGGVRKKGLIQYAKDHGLDPSSQAANYGFLKQELKGEYKYCIDAVKGKGLDGATKSFCTNFEKASDPQMGSRIALARQLSTTA